MPTAVSVLRARQSTLRDQLPNLDSAMGKIIKQLALMVGVFIFIVIFT
jgi:hypothetical protein